MASFDGQLAAEALTRLSDRHRHVLSLREESGLTYQEIASAEGVEVSTVETLLWRARQALKREYAALSGTRVLGGVLVAGGAMRRLLERLSRRATRLATAAGRIRMRDLAAAGVVTVALASVTGAPSLSAKAEPAPPPVTSTPAADTSSTAGLATGSAPTAAPLTVPAAERAAVDGRPGHPGRRIVGRGRLVGRRGLGPGVAASRRGPPGRLPGDLAGRLPGLEHRERRDGHARAGHERRERAHRHGGWRPPAAAGPADGPEDRVGRGRPARALSRTGPQGSGRTPVLRACNVSGPREQRSSREGPSSRFAG